jgi:signal transduction histidine kinase
MRRQKTAIFFLVLGIALSAIAVGLNIGWIILNLREAVLLILGVLFFTLIITGLILNTIFLVREIRRGEQQDAFLNAVTHELKTPIAAIKLYLDTLRSRDLPDDKRREFYEIIDAESNRLLNTVEQVLIAGRAKSAANTENLAEIDLGEVLQNAVRVIESRYKLPQGVIRLLEAADDPKVFGNRDELETVFVNLLDNAVKYSGDDRKISVRIRSGGRVEVIIRDNGVGLQPAELKRIFKRFYRAPGPLSKRVKGTGLGLFIVKTLIEKHGGRIRAESRGEGRGTTFIVRLPKA